MGANDLGVRFSNNIYATQQDVKKAMKIQLIDNIWNQILEYRSNFQIILSLKHITGVNYSICLTPTISERINKVERKLVRAMLNYSKLGKNGKRAFKENSLHIILKSIARKYKLEINESDLSNIINGNENLLSPDLYILSRYYDALMKVVDNYQYDINDDFLGLIYSALLGTNDLTEFYRTTEVNSGLSKVVINRLYLGVPVDNIETSMNSLITFLKTSNASLFVKAVSALYYAYYIKPFETFSEEISVLLFKNILAHNDLEEVSVFLNVEELLLNKEELEAIILESQRTLDLTYVIDYVLRKFESGMDEYLDRIVKSMRDEIKEETYSVDNKENKIENETVEKPVAEEISKPAVEEPKQTTSVLNYNKTIAFSNIPEGLSEEEASKLETRLLEIYPDLSRSQAYFYARHCTLGSKYTIAQFKKEVGCAYETARTSMDFLVYLGFYRKEPLKNKFVYIPVKKN